MESSSISIKKVVICIVKVTLLICQELYITSSSNTLPFQMTRGYLKPFQMTRGYLKPFQMTRGYLKPVNFLGSQRQLGSASGHITISTISKQL